MGRKRTQMQKVFNRNILDWDSYAISYGMNRWTIQENMFWKLFQMLLRITSFKIKTLTC